jgi:uncharacterized SAM-binding protein YcdF (DUF218 family)
MEQEPIITDPEFEARSELPTVIVLGSGFREDEAGKIIQPLQLGLEGKMRVLAAGMLFESGSTDKIIFSGGKTAGVDSESEARVMQEYLQRKFKTIPAEAIILEENSLSTDENAKNVQGILDNYEGGVIQQAILLTSQTHLARAKKIFARAGLDFLQGKAAEELLMSRSSKYTNHYLVFLDHYLNSPRVKKQKKRELILSALLLVDRQGKITDFLVKRRQKAR